MTEIIYTPGVCNIGKEEIMKRKLAGWIGLVVTILLTVVLVLLHLPHIVRLAVFLPAFVGAAGFVQAYFHFCVAFGQSGMYNFGAVGTTQTVTDEKAKKDDQKRTAQLYLYIVLIAVVITALTFLFK